MSAWTPRGGVLLRLALALSMMLVLSGHVGSPDVFHSGNAGPYAVEVVVRPPQVVPGIAEILVRTTDARVTGAVVRPVYWRAGSKGAPPGDPARPVAGAPGSFTGELWLMASGAYSVHVTLHGSAGEGTAIVPVAAVATGQLALSPMLKLLLGTLGLLLFAGVVTAVYAAVGESQVAPGATMPPERRRRARGAALVAALVVGLLAFGGAAWWRAEARAYARTLYRPMKTAVAVRDSAAIPMLTVSVVDSSWRSDRVSPVMPDHGKLAHMFLARADSNGVLAHLHPSMPDEHTFVTALPPLPAGRYRVYTDLVHETGFQRTLVDSFTLASPLAARGVPQLDADDAWFAGPTHQLTRTADAPLAGGITVSWAGTRRPVVGETGVLRFALRDSSGGPVVAEPYLGMQGHAVVMRRDGAVYIHLHPSGTTPMASALAFTLRDRGDTTAAGRLHLAAAEMTMPAAQPLRELVFPYAFPSAGAYRVWVQLRTGGAVRTASFDLDVAEAPQRER